MYVICALNSDVDKKRTTSFPLLRNLSFLKSLISLSV